MSIKNIISKEEKLTIDTIRVLSSEAIDRANSGHPGLPLGCAPIGYSLYADHLIHNPKNPDFFNRDRFVLSAGHGSMLLYSLLHIFGYPLTMEDIKQFRQFGSPAAGHPEYGHVKGIETSTGPLGQGIANAVGIAIAETMLATEFNKNDVSIIDHYTYALCGDGCMMEGIESEAASLAGTLQLGKLIVIYDSNNITIEGNTSIAFTEDVGKRHEAQGWQVLKVSDGEDIHEIGKAIQTAKNEKNKPSLIIVKTVIGYGSNKAGTAEAHGSPLGTAAIEGMKNNFGWDYPSFTIPQEIKAHIETKQQKFLNYEQNWERNLCKYKEKYPEEYAKFTKRISGVRSTVEELEPLFNGPNNKDATRNSGGIVLNKLARLMPSLCGGAADLAPSTKTEIKEYSYYSAQNREGKNIHFGIREHAMAAIANGIQVHGGFDVFCSTFFVFSDYMKNAMRLSAIMELPVLYILTHDSIGVGEDGPTHQPVEQLAALRTMPGINVYRPCDYQETAAAFINAVTGDEPTAIVLSRQNLTPTGLRGELALKGGYIVRDCEEKPQLLLIATGSEVGLAMKAYDLLMAEGIKVRVVSMPCVEVFEKQSKEYRENVILPDVLKRVVIEAGTTHTWYKYAGLEGAVIGIDTFGICGKAEDLMQHFGFTTKNIVCIAKKILAE